MSAPRAAPRPSLVASRRLRPLLPVALFVLGTSGCALTSKADLVGTRYFSPDVRRARVDAGEASRDAASRAPSGPRARELRLGKVSSSAHLRERIAFRDSSFETGYYEDQRWTERPEVYVRAELERALFGAAGFQRVLGGAAPTLDADLVAFDEVRLPSGRVARIELKVVLHDDRRVVFEETFVVDRAALAAGRPKIEELVAAMAEALDAVAQQVARRAAGVMAARTESNDGVPAATTTSP